MTYFLHKSLLLLQDEGAAELRYVGEEKPNFSMTNNHYIIYVSRAEQCK